MLVDFLRDVDRRWNTTGAEPIRLQVLGSFALFLQTDYRRGTRDGDVIRTRQMDGVIAEQLESLAGPLSALRSRHGLYLDLVGPNIPMLSYKATWHPTQVELTHFTVEVLDVVDVVVSKLRRFHSDDQDDVRAMIEGGHLKHTALIERFADVVGEYRFDARAADLPQMASRLNRAERDWFVRAETVFDLEDLHF